MVRKSELKQTKGRKLMKQHHKHVGLDVHKERNELGFQSETAKKNSGTRNSVMEAFCLLTRSGLMGVRPHGHNFHQLFFGGVFHSE